MMNTDTPSLLIDTLKRQKYHFVGRHSAVKSCRWFHETLTHNRPCYKQKFYGIKTHQCIQMTPAAFYCTQQCVFCWRAQNQDLRITWDETKLPRWDPPETIIEGSIKAQRLILSGYGGNVKTDHKKYREAHVPRHVAISLTGEPVLYENLGQLIEGFHGKKFTTFLVSNGTLPSTLARLKPEPTQLYVSVCAPDKETYAHVCRPQIPNAWEKLNETLTILPSFSCPTVLRITSVYNLNMKNVKGYAASIKKANPTYVEVKAYVHVGFSRLRLNFDSMPSHRDIRHFAIRIAEETGYDIIDESNDSRVVLLSRLKKARRFGDG
jgi:tRNA wybutosine-synthesizing protein 1